MIEIDGITEDPLATIAKTRSNQAGRAHQISRACLAWWKGEQVPENIWLDVGGETPNMRTMARALAYQLGGEAGRTSALQWFRHMLESRGPEHGEPGSTTYGTFYISGWSMLLWGGIQRGDREAIDLALAGISCLVGFYLLGADGFGRVTIAGCRCNKAHEAARDFWLQTIVGMPLMSFEGNSPRWRENQGQRAVGLFIMEQLRRDGAFDREPGLMAIESAAKGYLSGTSRTSGIASLLQWARTPDNATGFAAWRDAKGVAVTMFGFLECHDGPQPATVGHSRANAIEAFNFADRGDVDAWMTGPHRATYDENGAVIIAGGRVLFGRGGKKGVMRAGEPVNTDWSMNLGVRPPVQGSRVFLRSEPIRAPLARTPWRSEWSAPVPGGTAAPSAPVEPAEPPPATPAPTGDLSALDKARLAALRGFEALTSDPPRIDDALGHLERAVNMARLAKG